MSLFSFFRKKDAGSEEALAERPDPRPVQEQAKPDPRPAKDFNWFLRRLLQKAEDEG